MEIVIPPIEHTYKSITYTCTGEGLYKDGYLYDAHPEKFFPPKVPKSSKAPLAEPKEIEKKPVAYWKAQCAFRGLNQSGAISDLQLRIREAKKKMLPELKMAEMELNREFKKKNKVAKDAAAKDGWNSLKTVEAKAKANPQKFLTEAFPNGATGRPANLDIVLVKIDNPYRLALADAADAMGLEAVTVDAPWTGKKRPSPDRWVIVGRLRDAVWDQMRQIERETARSKQDLAKEKSQTSAPAKQNAPKEKALTLAKAAKPKEVKKTAPQSLDQPSSSSSRPARTKQTARPSKETLEKWAALKAAGHYVPDPVWPPKKEEQEPSPLEPSSSSPHRKKQTAIPSKAALAKFAAARAAGHPGPGPVHVPKRELEVDAKPLGGFDATGSFRINCPEIEEQWGGSPLSLDIHISTSNGKTQMFGLFHFNVIYGVMRFEKPIPVPKLKSEPSDSKKRKWEADEEDDDGDINMEGYPEYYEEESIHYSNSVFNLGAKDKPTARRPTWRYRWRGKESGEGEIQLNSDKQVQSITFSKKGDQLSGTFNGGFAGRDCKFTGTKIRSASPPAVDPDSKWDDYSERAYDYASRSRWGKSGW